MCECNGTGKRIELLGAGMISFTPCSCEASQQALKRSWAGMAEFELRLIAAEQELARCTNRA